MEYQTFRGSNVVEALTHVRQAFGANALIESTRHVSTGRAGSLSGSFVEIVAAPSEPPSAIRKPRVARRRSQSPAVEQDPLQAALGVALGRSALTSPVLVQPQLRDTEVGRELAQLRLMLDEMSQGRPPKDRTRALLAAAGFEGALARQLGTGATRAARAGSRELRQWLRERVGSRLLCRSGLLESPGRRLIACVGPTGVGKTTTLAKLAAQARLESGRTVRVISLDTFRVGAVEQWARYAELIGFPFDVANNAGAFHRIVHGNEEEIILVDTAGLSKGEENTLLGSCIGGLRDIASDVLLVLPAWLRARDAERALLSYAVPAATGVVVTKLDETDQVGGVMHAPLGSQLPLAYLCDGARVPEDIHDAQLDEVLDAIFPEQS